MRKKYLSALLFGALLFASAGTFTSCKDYDDDINNLQSQITSNKDAIAALQKLVGEGKWVTSISPIENGFTVTMSDGSTQNITGIDGEDGKPGTVISLDPTTNNWIIDGVDTGICAKGEKGDQGDQGEQGPAGEDGAQGAQGEPGKNAPSPQIDPETGNWIVYAWDEATGDYKATVTDIYAQAAKIFVTEKEGFIELNVDGVAYLLPTTSDAYTVEAPYKNVVINVETAKWNPTTTSADYQTLLKKFPEIGEIEKNQLLKQGAELPVLVTPANIDLTQGFKFSLQTLADGALETISLSDPEKGLSDAWKIQEAGTSVDGKYVEESYMTRSASAADCYWTLKVEQQMTKENEYAEAKNAALVVENANGKVVKTPFAYTIVNKSITNPKVNGAESGKGTDGVAEFSSEIDLFASSVEGMDAPIVLESEFEGKYIITLTDQLAVEKYGLEIVDGHKLVIKNPGNNTTIPVELNVVVLGLNGKTANVDVEVTVSQSISATENLSDQNITLSTTLMDVDGYTNKQYAQIVKWKFEELGFTTATQKNAFVKAVHTLNFKDSEGNYIPEGQNNYSADIKFYKADGKTTTTNYEEVAYFGFVALSEKFVEDEYTLELQSVAAGTSSVIYKTEANMKVSNPKVEDLFGLASAYTTDGEVLQVVGNIPVNEWINYDLNNGVVNKKTGVAKLMSYSDYDHTTWTESDGSTTWGIADWVQGSYLVIPVQGNKFTDISTTEADESKETTSRLYQEREIRATYYLFGNTKNEVNYDFKVKVLSPVYTADGSNITADESKMTGKFADGKNNTIETKSNISATYAAGINNGKTMNLFENTPSETNYASPQMIDSKYVKGTTDGYVEIDHSDLIYLGVSTENIAKLANYKIYLTNSSQTIDGVKIEGWQYINTNSTTSTKVVFNKYSKLIKFNTKDGNKVERATEIKSISFAFVNSSDATKYCNGIDNDGTITLKQASEIKTSDLVDGKAVVAVKMTVKDYWGMTMTKTFNVTITKE